MTEMKALITYRNEIPKMIDILDFERIKISANDICNYDFPLFDVYSNQTTSTHSVNVAILSKHLCKFLEIEPYEIVLGALLHDIGKRQLPKEILEKEGELLESERVIVETHPLLGYLLLPSDIPYMSKQIVLLHHEDVTGNGYPFHSKDVPTEVRIVHFCDIYDALRQKRSYKDSLSKEEALCYLGEHLYQFFPEVRE